MSVSPGSRLGPYEILSPIGAGGMGEVYKARDTRLDRSVAIKVLPVEFAQNAALRLRFEREARTISQLNHPNICTLFDVGDDYLVMELLEGEPLADRIARGPLPAADVLRYGTEIAEALDKAHRSGVVHRDLKPGNVMLTKSGAKLLDFGLAKGGNIAVSLDDATQQRPLTQEGTILGTFQYMSPEQLEGTEADARSDIFALGCVLYEMATGRRAFDGKTKTSLIAAIVKEHPRPIAELQPLTPPALQHVVDKCLAKDPDDRWQSVHDVAAELKWISSAGSQAGVAAPIAVSRSRRRKEIVAAAIVGWIIAIAAAGAAFWLRSQLRKADPLIRAELTNDVASTAITSPLAVSPDGSHVVTVVASGKTWQLAVRDLRSGIVKPLPGTEGAQYPFWSPDNQSIGFFASGKLKSIAVDSGAVQTIADAPGGRGGAWSPVGIIVFAPQPNGAIYKVAETGGAPVAVTKVLDPVSTDRNPVFLRDGKHFLYVEGLAGDTNSIQLGSIEGGAGKKILNYGSTMAVVGDWLLTVRDGNLLAQPFDQRTFSITGKPVPIAQHIDWYGPKYNAAFAVGGDTLVYEPAARPSEQFFAADSDTATPVPFGETGWYFGAALSPDGKRLITSHFDPAESASDLWVLDVRGTAAQRITYAKNSGIDLNVGEFSPDGQRVAVSIAANNGTTKSWVQSLGGGSHESLPAKGQYAGIRDWRADGTMLVGSQSGMSTLKVGAADSVPVALNSNALNARFSPDGKFVVYDPEVDGHTEIFVGSFPSGAARWQISVSGETPFWSPDGTKIYFVADGVVMSAAVRITGDGFTADPPQPVRAFGDHIEGFAISKSGRFVILRALDPGKAPLALVLNWRRMLEK